MNWYLEALKKYVVFEGRSPRIEFWMFTLFNFIICIVLSIISQVIGVKGILVSIYSLAIILPSISLTVRRIHDFGKTGWLALVLLVPFLNTLAWLIFGLLPSQPESNQYGPEPN